MITTLFLTDRQAAMLKQLMVEPHNIAQLVDAMGLQQTSNGNIRYNIGRLQERGMIELWEGRTTVENGREQIGATYCITADGKHALRQHGVVTEAKPVGDTAQPNRINIFKLPTYRTPKSYARNDGNVHIASRGWV